MSLQVEYQLGCNEEGLDVKLFQKAQPGRAVRPSRVLIDRQTGLWYGPQYTSDNIESYMSTLYMALVSIIFIDCNSL